MGEGAAGDFPPSRPVPRWEWTLAVLIALVAGLISLTLTWWVFEGIPHVSDGISYHFQARIFASGRLWLEPPPLPRLFQQQGVLITDDCWCSIYPPGWPAALAVGHLIRAPWLVNPVLLALAVAGLWRLGRLLFDGLTGLLAALALAVSPFALLMGAGDLAHVAALCAWVWSFGALVRGAETGRPRPLLLGGLLGGWGFLTRPYTAVFLWAPVVSWVLWPRRGEKCRLPAVGWMALGALPSVALHLTYQWLLFGHPLRSGYDALEPGHAFGGSVGGLLPLGWPAVARLGRYLSDLGRGAWVWLRPDFLMAATLLICRREWRRVALLAACAAGLILAHSVYAYYDICYSGPRLVFEAMGPLALLLGRTAATLAWSLRAGQSKAVRRSLVAAATVALLAPCAARLANQARHHAQAYHGQTLEPLRRAEALGVGDQALIFVTGRWFSYGSVFLRNALDPLDGPRIYARALEPQASALMRLAPRPEIWSVEVVLDPLPGPNDYNDAWRVRDVIWRRLDGGAADSP